MAALGWAQLSREVRGKTLALARVDESRAARSEGVEVLSHRLVLEHLRVHRRGDEHGRSGGGVQRGQEVVGDPIGELPDDVGGRGREQDQLRPVAELHVRLRRTGRQPQTSQNRVACDALKRRGTDETGSRRRHRNTHLAPSLCERGGEVDHLVRGDAAGYEQGKAEAMQLGRYRGSV